MLCYAMLCYALCRFNGCITTPLHLASADSPEGAVDFGELKGGCLRLCQHRVWQHCHCLCPILN
jgi:hypothetical protein